MKIFALALLFIAMIVNSASAHMIYAPDNKILRVHLALLQAKPGKMSEMAAISSRTVAKFTRTSQLIKFTGQAKDLKILFVNVKIF